VPSVCRRIAALLVIACLGAGLPASLAVAQDAGDEQYQDPFAGTSKPKPKPKPGSQTTTAPSGTAAPLSSTPQSSAGQSANSASATTAAADPSELPRTGLDVRIPLAAGAALLLIGLLLRLRTRPERS
jgi:hypothetical protein